MEREKEKEKKTKPIPPSVFALASNFIEYIEEADKKKQEKSRDKGTGPSSHL